MSMTYLSPVAAPSSGGEASQPIADYGLIAGCKSAAPVDRDGSCGPGGIWVISPAGEHLGTPLTSIYRIRLQIPGIRPQ